MRRRRRAAPDAPGARRGHLRGDRARRGARLPGRGRRRGPRRPVPAPAHARRAGPAPDRRGPARAAVDGARRPAPRDGGRRRSRSGRPTRAGVRVVGDFTGWGPHDGWPMRSLGGSGVWELFVPDAARRAALQVPDPGRATASGGTRPTRWPRTPRCRRAPRRWSTSSDVRVGRRRLAGPRGPAAAAPGADERLRGAPGLVAARPVLPGAGRAAHRRTWSSWASPTWSSCR